MDIETSKHKHARDDSNARELSWRNNAFLMVRMGRGTSTLRKSTSHKAHSQTYMNRSLCLVEAIRNERHLLVHRLCDHQASLSIARCRNCLVHAEQMCQSHTVPTESARAIIAIHRNNSKLINVETLASRCRSTFSILKSCSIPTFIRTQQRTEFKMLFADIRCCSE